MILSGHFACLACHHLLSLIGGKYPLSCCFDVKGWRQKYETPVALLTTGIGCLGFVIWSLKYGLDSWHYRNKFLTFKDNAGLNSLHHWSQSFPVLGLLGSPAFQKNPSSVARAGWMMLWLPSPTSFLTYLSTSTFSLPQFLSSSVWQKRSVHLEFNLLSR